MIIITKIEEMEILNNIIQIMILLKLQGYKRNIKTAIALKMVARCAELNMTELQSLELEFQALLAMNEIVVKD